MGRWAGGRFDLRAVAQSARRHPRRVQASFAVVAFGLWWWWPTLTADHDRVDVLVVAEGQIPEQQVPVERRIRERGLSVVVAEVPTSWCDAVSVVERGVSRHSPNTVVVSVRADDPACSGFGVPGDTGWSDLRRAAGRAELVLVVQPGADAAGQSPGVVDAITSKDGWIVADPTPLLGVEAFPRLACQWWDDCEEDGAVTVRDDGGVLTPAGGERVARVLAAVLP